MGILVTVLIGFLAALIVPWLHRKETSATGWWLAAIPAALSVYLAGWIPRVADEGAVRIVYPWVGALDVHLSFLVDGLSLFFALLVCIVGIPVFIYSGPYMEGRSHAGRFYGYLLFFMASMLGLVLADGIFALYVFFELTSLASFLLIGFEHDDETSRSSAWQALLVTAAGGFALMAGLILLGGVTGTYELSQMMDRGPDVRAARLYLPILLLVLAGAFTKSAQFPFYFWLPNAMAAPTPVSAYLHSATMVKAGIYLLARFSPLLGGTNAWVAIVTGTGALTMVLASFLALRHVNLKRLLAYSTVMALGLLTMLLGVGSEGAVLGCMTFVAVHALYKAPLFMVAGTLEHQAGSYDLAKVAGLRSALPITFGAAVVAALSMAGIPPLLGFAGKETILNALLETDVRPHLLTASAVLASAAITAAAGLAALRPFIGRRRAPAETVRRASAGLWLPPVLLAALGLLLGLAPSFVSRRLLEPATSNVLAAPVSEQLELWHGLTPELGLSAATIALGLALYAAWTRLHDSAGMRTFAAWFGEGLDRAYHAILHGLIGVARWQTRVLQHGVLRHYTAASIAASVLLIGYALVRRADIGRPELGVEMFGYETAALGLLIVAAVGVVVARTRFTAVLSLSAAGFSVAAIFLIFGAPDAAMVQLLIETLTMILVVIALIDMPEAYHEPGRDRWRYRNVVIALSTGAVVTLLMLAVLEIPLDNAVGEFYARNSVDEVHARNVVNAILLSFRSFDTLGEVTVLVAAALGAYALIRRHDAVREDPPLDPHTEETS